MVATSADKVRLILVPFGMGSAVPGAEDAPGEIVTADWLDAVESAGCSVEVTTVAGEDDFACAPSLADNGVRNVEAVKRMALNVRYAVMDALSRGRVPLVIGGDHSVAIGSIAGHKDFFALRRHSSLVWFDAHADMNTPETSPSGSPHGMPLAVVFGAGHSLLLAVQTSTDRIAPQDTLLIGVRSTDYGEEQFVASSGIQTISGREPYSQHDAIARLNQWLMTAKSRRAALHVSLDLDVFSEDEKIGVSYSVPGGPSLDDVLQLLDMVLSCEDVASMDIVELNPQFDKAGHGVRLAREIIRAFVRFRSPGCARLIPQ